MNILSIFRRALTGPEIAIFHEFQKPPYGGGNQFLLALEKELKQIGLDVGRNKIGSRTRTCLFNSYNFDFERLKRLAQRFSVEMVHRVDGPISVYRGTDGTIDKDIWKMNHALADKTIFQSQYSLDKHLELGLSFKNPTVIPNAADPAIFHKEGRIAPPDGNRRIKLIATAWSDNPKKGGPMLAWLDEHLDYSRYELTFVGRTQASFKGARFVEPVPSNELADLLREHDIYLAPSQDDPCSNALIEALSCGLPAAYLKSGGHPELVKSGGEGFSSEEEMIGTIEKIIQDYRHYQDSIQVLSLREVAMKYLAVFNH